MTKFVEIGFFNKLSDFEPLVDEDTAGTPNGPLEVQISSSYKIELRDLVATMVEKMVRGNSGRWGDNVPYLSDYAKKDDVYSKQDTYSASQIDDKFSSLPIPSLEGYATQNWSNQNFAPITLLSLKHVVAVEVPLVGSGSSTVLRFFYDSSVPNYNDIINNWDYISNPGESIGVSLSLSGDTINIIPTTSIFLDLSLLSKQIYKGEGIGSGDRGKYRFNITPPPSTTISSIRKPILIFIYEPTLSLKDYFNINEPNGNITISSDFDFINPVDVGAQTSTIRTPLLLISYFPGITLPSHASFGYVYQFAV